MNRRLHRVLGAVVAAQVLVWLVTGVLFNVKHRYAEAYETLAAPPASVDPASIQLAPAAAVARAGGGATDVALVIDARGAAYRITRADGEAAWIDAVTGAPRAPLDEAGARAIAAAAVGASHHRARYGAIASARLARGAWTLALATGQTLRVDANDASITHAGPLHTFIDWTYRAHYMQYTPWKRVNMILVIAWVVFTATLLGTGLCLLWRTWRPGSSRAAPRTLPE